MQQNGSSELIEAFRRRTRRDPVYYASAPGRTELGGNHTDHQHGRALAAAVDLLSECLAAPNDEGVVTVHSRGHRPCVVRVDELERSPRETGRSTAMVRGILAGLHSRGVELRGLDVYAANAVPGGSGLSSSAAFEVMLGALFHYAFTGEEGDPVELAKIGQFAENVYYGKPCGLLDQTASSVGGATFLDFKDPSDPRVQRLDFDPGAAGYALAMVQSGAGHASLTGEYAAITEEMFAAARAMGADVLRQVPEEDFYAALPRLRKELGDRAAMRAMHFYAEDARAALEADALRRGDFKGFLDLVNESGRSSWMLLQNVAPLGSREEQPMALTLALCAHLLGGEGASRIQGGGFAGVAQAYIPLKKLDAFVAGVEAVLGKGACQILRAGVPGRHAEAL